MRTTVSGEATCSTWAILFSLYASSGEATCPSGYASSYANACDICAPGYSADGFGFEQSCRMCMSNMYSYGGDRPFCTSCSSNSTIISASLGCRPSSPFSAAPFDTSFYLSGTQTENKWIFTPNRHWGVTFSEDVFGTSNAAMTFASGSYLSLSGSLSPSSLPSNGNVAWTLSAWVKCPSRDLHSSIIEWGETQKNWASLRGTAALIVGGVGPSNSFGMIYGSTLSPYGLAVDKNTGFTFFANRYDHTIGKISPSGEITTVLSGLDYPAGLAIDGESNIYIADSFSKVKKLLPNGDILGTLIDVNLNDDLYGLKFALDKDYNVIYIAGKSQNEIKKLLPNGTSSIILGSQLDTSILDEPYGVTIDEHGTLYVTSTHHNLIKKMFANGTVVTLLNVALYAPNAVAAANGSLFIADTLNSKIKKIDIDGVVTTLLDTDLNSPFGITIDSNDNLLISDTLNNAIKSVNHYSYLPACDKTWHHISLSYAPSTFLLSSFIDGVISNERTLMGAVILPSPALSTLRIGWNGALNINSGSLYSGSISDLRVYNRTLSPEEILSLASFPSSPSPSTSPSTSPSPTTSPSTSPSTSPTASSSSESSPSSSPSTSSNSFPSSSSIVSSSPSSTTSPSITTSSITSITSSATSSISSSATSSSTLLTFPYDSDSLIKAASSDSTPLSEAAVSGIASAGVIVVAGFIVFITRLQSRRRSEANAAQNVVVISSNNKVTIDNADVTSLTLAELASMSATYLDSPSPTHQVQPPPRHDTLLSLRNIPNTDALDHTSIRLRSLFKSSRSEARESPSSR